MRRLPWLYPLATLLAATTVCAADETAVHDFDRAIKPLLERHCYACHNAKVSKGDVDLATLVKADALAGDTERVQTLWEVVSENFMPPNDAPRPLSEADRRVVLEWLEQRLADAAKAQAGDPGQVVVRRLTNAELNYTLADLTGLARDWTKDFPRDGSGGEGFSNTGQTLQMSAGQIEKYLELSQRLAASVLVLPGSGPVFSEPPVPRVEWPRLALQRLGAFCDEYSIEYRDVTPPEQLMSYAYPEGKSPRLDFGPTGLRGYSQYSNARPGDPLQFLLTSHRLFYRNERLCPSPLTFAVPRGAAKVQGRELPGDAARQWDNLWLDFRYASGYARPFKVSLLHRWFSFQPYRLGDNPEFEASIRQWPGRKPLDPARQLSFTVLSLADLIRDIRPTTAAELKDYANIQNSADGESMGTMVPNHDAFDAFIHLSLDDEQIEKLWKMACDPQSALAERLGGVPPAAMQAEWAALDAKQREWQARALASSKESLCDFVARAWRRPLTPVETAGFHSRIDRAMDKGQLLSDAVQDSLVHVFLSPNFLYRIERGRERAAGEELDRAGLGGSLALPERALPERGVARSGVAGSGVAGSGVAGREGETRAGDVRDVRPLDDFELASRLSYFLWSSMPDDELWAAAARGELSDPAGLAAQARRMLQDRRIRRFATELFGQWLGFYRFDEFQGPGAERFPEFDAELRHAMFGEAVEFCSDLVANDRDVRLLLEADYAFLPSRRLAEHYGLSNLGDPADDAWAKNREGDAPAELANREGDAPAEPNFDPGDTVGVVTAPRISLADTPRRGVLGWGAVLAATSHPLRTSPVLRGNWILSDLLGIPTPPPPAAVDELPEDEKNGQGLTVAQLLAKHRQNAACAACHDRIDPLGLALENFDAIGRFRSRDANGTLIDSRANLHDGRPLEGVAGLVAYINEEKQQRLFVRRLSGKVLGYALGRSLTPGDTLLLDEIQQKLSANEGRFSTIVEAVVTSRQFRYLKHEPAATAIDEVER